MGSFIIIICYFISLEPAFWTTLPPYSSGDCTVGGSKEGAGYVQYRCLCILKPAVHCHSYVGASSPRVCSFGPVAWMPLFVRFVVRWFPLLFCAVRRPPQKCVRGNVFLEPGVCALLVVVGFSWSWAWSRGSLLRLLGRYLGSVPVPGGLHLAVYSREGAGSFMRVTLSPHLPL